MNGHRKRTGLTASGIAAALSCMLFFSCNNEDYLTTQDPEKACDNICFGVSPDESVRTRGGDNGKEKEYTSDHFVLRSQDSADTLCVRAIVSEGISTAESDTRKVITRGAPLTEDNFDKFHVLAYWKKDGSSVDQFYMNEDATKNGDIWSTDRTYYWPGAAHNLQFYAWAPVDAEFTSIPTSPTETTLAYTVPANAADQKDIVVATTDEIRGDNDAAVPLTFRHICTAVRFAVGKEMQSGTIKSVTLKGIGNSGTFDMATSAWRLNEATTADFTQILNKSMAGNEADGAEITPLEGTFMMLPQTLPAGAIVEVVFFDPVANHDRTLSATIGGSEWKMGTTVTYKLTITPEFDLEFTSTPALQDAHYVIYPITIHIGETMPNHACIIESTDPNVTLRDDLSEYEKQGYWVEEEKGEGTIEVTGVSGDFTIYAFVTENVGDRPRNFTLNLYPRPVSISGGKPVDTFTFTQLCPSWNGDVGCERFETTTTYPWGFGWDSNYKVVYDFSQCGFWDRADIRLRIWGMKFLSWLGIVKPDDVNYIEYSSSLVFTTVTLNFGSLDISNVAQHLDDGLANSKELFNFHGMGNVADMMEFIESHAGYNMKNEGNGISPTDFAVRYAVGLNKFNLEDQGAAGKVVYCKDENMVWYLPARDEFTNGSIEDEQYPLSGQYWTSTAETDVSHDNMHAYMFDADSKQIVDAERKTLYKARAARRKQVTP